MWARMPSGMSFTLAGSVEAVRRSIIFLRRLRKFRLCVDDFPNPGGTGGWGALLCRNEREVHGEQEGAHCDFANSATDAFASFANTVSAALGADLTGG